MEGKWIPLERSWEGKYTVLNLWFSCIIQGVDLDDKPISCDKYSTTEM